MLGSPRARPPRSRRLPDMNGLDAGFRTQRVLVAHVTVVFLFSSQNKYHPCMCAALTFVYVPISRLTGDRRPSREAREAPIFADSHRNPTT